MDQPEPPDRLQASAARFLIDGGQDDAAALLLSCSLELRDSTGSWWVGNEQVHGVAIELRGPRAAYDVLRRPGDPLQQAIREALEAVLPYDVYLDDLRVRPELIDIDPDWRSELLEIARGRGVHNQAASCSTPLTWSNLRFRSKSEIMIARALDRAGVLFLPNCLMRLSTATGRQNREADFLICKGGKWGILEVDGEPFHPPSRAAEDHERDRLFRSYGIRVVEHFDASRCYNQPDEVVGRFLEILERS